MHSLFYDFILSNLYEQMVSKKRNKREKSELTRSLLTYKKIWRIPIFTGSNPQLSSALLSLTSVFGMGTGVTSAISSPENYYAFLKFSDKIDFTTFVLLCQ